MGLFKSIFSGWKDYFWITIGSIVSAIAINIFLVPYKIAPGGITGVATVLYYISGGKLLVGVTTLALNIPLFILGIKLMGGRFGFLTLISTILQSVVIDITEPFTRNIFTQYSTSSPDLLLFSIFGGFFMGIGLGLIFRSGATSGGTDIAAGMLNHCFPHITVGQILMIMDSAIVIFAAIVFNSILLALYAIIAIFICSKVIDTMIEGVNFAKAVFIISEKTDEISKEIIDELERSATLLRGMGMYSRTEKNVLYCVLQRNQLTALKKIVKKIDTNAFVILSDVREVLGEGFKSHI